MRLTINDGKAFTRLFDTVMRFTGGQMFENVLCTVDKDGKLLLSACSVESSIIAQCHNVLCDGSGSAIFPAKSVSALLKKVDAPIHIEFKDEKCIVESGKCRYRFAVPPVDSFPDMSGLHSGETLCSVKTQDIAKAILFGGTCATLKNEYPVYIAGVHINTSGNIMEIASTDTNRLSVSTIGCSDVVGDGIDAILPWRVMKDACRVIEQFQDEEIRITEGKGALCFTGSDISISVRRLAAAFPKIKSIIPQKQDALAVCTILRKELLGSIQRISVVSTKDTGCVKLSPDVDGISLSAAVEGACEINEFIQSDWNGQSFDSGWNIDFLSSGVSAFDDDVLELFLYGAEKPMIIAGRDESSRLYLVMSISLSSV